MLHTYHHPLLHLAVIQQHEGVLALKQTTPEYLPAPHENLDSRPHVKPTVDACTAFGIAYDPSHDGLLQILSLKYLCTSLSWNCKNSKLVED